MATRKDLPKPIDDLRKARRWPKGVPMPKPGAYSSHARWTSEEDELLRQHYMRYGAVYVARLLGRSPEAVWAHAQYIGLKGRGRRWTAAEIRTVKKHYGRMPSGELARLLGRPRRAMTAKAHDLGLTVVALPWSAEEIRQLRKLYGTMSAAEIGRRLGRSDNAVMDRARSLGLAKTVKPVTKAMVRTIMKNIGRVAVTEIVAELGIGAYRIKEIAAAHGYQATGQWWKKQWTAREDAFLKKHRADMRVVDMAQHLGCTRAMVENRIRALGLPRKREPARRDREWSQSDSARLRKWYRTLNDKELAARLERTAADVQRHIKALGLRRPDARTAVRRWTAAEESLLRNLWASKRCEDIALRLGRSVGGTKDRANRLGLLPERSAPERWSAEEDALLRRWWQQSTMSELAERVGRSPAAVQHRLCALGLAKRRVASAKPWTEEDDRLLATLYGTRPNKEIAPRLSRTVSSIVSRAGRLGVSRRKSE